MKKLIITIKPQHLCNILNGIKTIEVRKNKNLANTVKKLIAENGKCHIKCACSKSNKFDLDNDGKKWFCWDKKSHHYPFKNLNVDYYNGKIVCEIVVDMIEEIYFVSHCDGNSLETDYMPMSLLLKSSCLTKEELGNYLCLNKEGIFVWGETYGYALHIKRVIPYEKPQENKRVIQNYAYVEE